MFLKDPKDSGTLFLLPFFHPLLSGSCWLLLKGLERTGLREQWTSRLKDRGIVPIPEGLVFCAHLCINIKWEVEGGCVTMGVM
jgi:hypothetical protein